MLVTCVKVGRLYGPDYVNRLASMVARHTTRPARFLCLTDDPTGLECESVPIDTDLPGWWAKLILFKPHPRLIGERTVFLDLDTIIVGTMDFLLDYAGDFAILRDFYRHDGWGSAIMSIAPGFGQQVWSGFDRKRMAHHAGDQGWIREQVDFADLWQDVAPGKIVSYKVDVQPHGVNGASVVCFHGVPKPHELPVGDPLRAEWERP